MIYSKFSAGEEQRKKDKKGASGAFVGHVVCWNTKCHSEVQKCYHLLLLSYHLFSGYLKYFIIACEILRKKLVTETPTSSGWGRKFHGYSINTIK